jgi:hypothetical protein
MRQPCQSKKGIFDVANLAFRDQLYANEFLQGLHLQCRGLLSRRADANLEPLLRLPPPLHSRKDHAADVMKDEIVVVNEILPELRDRMGKNRQCGGEVLRLEAYLI